MSLIVGTSNVLGWHHTEPGGKNAGWPDGVVRMDSLLDAWTVAGAAVVGLQELEDPMARVMRRDPRGRLRRSQPNNRLRGGNTQGTGIWFDPEQVGLVRYWNLRTPMQGRRLGLNSCAAIFRTRDKYQGERVKFGAISVHRPRLSIRSNIPLRVSRQARDAMDSRVEQVIHNWRKRGLPGFVLADGNTGSLPIVGTENLHKHGPDHVRGTRGDWERLGGWAIPTGTASDHSIVVARVRPAR